MPMKFAHDCGARMSIPDRVAGRRVRCPKCRKAFVAPSPAEAIPLATLAADAEIPLARLVPDPPLPPLALSAWVALAGLALLAASGLSLLQGSPRIPVISATLMVACVVLAVRFRSRRDRAIARRGVGDDERTDAVDAEAAVEARRALAAGWFALTYLFKVLLSIALIAADDYTPLIGAVVMGFMVTLVGGLAARNSPSAPFPSGSGAAPVDSAVVARFARGVVMLIVIGLALFIAFVLLAASSNSRFGC